MARQCMSALWAEGGSGGCGGCLSRSSQRNLIFKYYIFLHRHLKHPPSSPTSPQGALDQRLTHRHLAPNAGRPSRPWRRAGRATWRSASAHATRSQELSFAAVGRERARPIRPGSRGARLFIALCAEAMRSSAGSRGLGKAPRALARHRASYGVRRPQADRGHRTPSCIVRP
jgi:hypothetical protein